VLKQVSAFVSEVHGLRGDIWASSSIVIECYIVSQLGSITAWCTLTWFSRIILPQCFRLQAYGLVGMHSDVRSRPQSKRYHDFILAALGFIKLYMWQANTVSVRFGKITGSLRTITFLIRVISFLLIFGASEPSMWLWMTFRFLKLLPGRRDGDDQQLMVWISMFERLLSGATAYLYKKSPNRFL
jgi:hypothetical protein